MNGGAWLDAETVTRLTAWSAATLWRKVKDGSIESRPASRVSANGKRTLEYSLRSLPPEAQQKAFTLQIGAAATASQIQRSDPNQLAFPEEALQGAEPRDRIILDSEHEQEAAKRFAPVDAFHSIKKRGPDANGVLLRLQSGRELRTYREVSEYIAEQHGITAKTLWERYARFKESGYTALATRVRSDKGSFRYFERNPVVGTYAKKLYLADGNSFRTVHDLLLHECERRGFKIPSYETVRCYLSSLPEALKTFAREGERKYHEKCEPFIIRRYDDKLPNDIWVSDHMKFDVWVRNDGVFSDVPDNAAVRPWLTAVIDFRSRKVLGYTVSMNPSSATIATALRQAMIAYGPPQISFYVDNGKDFRSLAHALERLGITTEHCKPRWPQSKHIERFFGTLHTQFDKQWAPFYCGPSAAARPDHCEKALKIHKKLLDRGSGEDSHLPPASEFIQMAIHWMEKRYNATHDHTGQGMDGRTPDEVFNEGYPTEQRRALTPEQMHCMDIVFRKQARCTIQKGMYVTVNRHRYEPANAETSAQMFELMGREVIVACDPQNIGEALLTDLEGRPIGMVQATELLSHGPISQEQVARIERHRALLRKAMNEHLRGMVEIAAARGQISALDMMRNEAGIVAAPRRVQRHRSLAGVSVVTTSTAPDYVEDVVDEVRALMQKGEDLNGTQLD